MRIKAAVDARKGSGSDIVIVARTDSRQAVSFEEALWRARALADAGADVLFIDALASIEEMKAFCDVYPLVPKMVCLLSQILHWVACLYCSNIEGSTVRCLFYLVVSVCLSQNEVVVINLSHGQGFESCYTGGTSNPFGSNISDKAYTIASRQICLKVVVKRQYSLLLNLRNLDTKLWHIHFP